MHSETLEYRDGDTVLEAYVAFDDSISGPRLKMRIMIKRDLQVLIKT